MKNSRRPLVIPHKETGSLITMRTITDSSTGEEREVGTVMVQSKSLSGFGALTRVSTRTAFITLEQDAIDFIKDELKANQPVPFEGKIVIRETLEPYIKKNGESQEPKVNPSTGEVITYQGQPVYRNMEFTEDMNAQDVFLREVNTGVEEEVPQGEEGVE